MRSRCGPKWLSKEWLSKEWLSEWLSEQHDFVLSDGSKQTGAASAALEIFPADARRCAIRRLKRHRALARNMASLNPFAAARTIIRAFHRSSTKHDPQRFADHRIVMLRRAR
jgi:hypothetical protein